MNAYEIQPDERAGFKIVVIKPDGNRVVLAGYLTRDAAENALGRHMARMAEGVPKPR